VSDSFGFLPSPLWRSVFSVSSCLAFWRIAHGWRLAHNDAEPNAMFSTAKHKNAPGDTRSAIVVAAGDFNFLSGATHE
jgi:hypothetical protein